MGIILLTGIPGSGRESIIDATIALGEKQEPMIPIEKISWADAFAEKAKDLNLRKDRLSLIDPFVQKSLETSIIKGSLAKIGEYVRKGAHIIIDKPLTYINRDGLPAHTMRMGYMRTLYDAGYKLDRVVCLVNDPHIVLENLAVKHKGQGYSRSIDQASTQTVSEVDRSDDFASVYTPDARLLTMTPDKGEFLLKLLVDPTAPIVYFAFPITALKSSPGAKAKIMAFGDTLQKYVNVVKPMELADLRTTSYTERAFTKHRDLQWFAGQSDFVVAYYPKPEEGDANASKGFESIGVSSELAEASMRAIPSVWVQDRKETEKDEIHPFGRRADFPFTSPEQFFGIVRNSPNNSEYVLLESMLDPLKVRPRFEHLIL